MPGWLQAFAANQPVTVATNALRGLVLGQGALPAGRTVTGQKKEPAIVGHAFGGLLTQILAGRGLAAASVAIDPAPFRGMLPLPISALKSSAPVLGNPANRNRAVPLTYEQFRQAATANLNPWTEARVDTRNPDRGPLLIISGEKDHTVPWAIANASSQQQQDNEGVTEIVQVPNRGHALTIDSGWREVADKALAFVKRFV
jgi:non-heme chloroperoxidase